MKNIALIILNWATSVYIMIISLSQSLWYSLEELKFQGDFAITEESTQCENWSELKWVEVENGINRINCIDLILKLRFIDKYE